MCPEEDSYFDLCVRVFYGDGKRSQDWILAKEHPKAQTVLKGHLKSEPKTKVVIILGDEENAMDVVSITFTNIRAGVFLGIFEAPALQSMRNECSFFIIR